MEFKFSVNDIFKSPMVEINHTLIPPGFTGDRRTFWDAVGKVSEVVNAMGEASAAAQGLTKPITTAERLRNSEHKVYLLIDQNASNGRGAVTGMLKIGKKGLYVFDRNGQHYQVSPPCVLDFYIHESRQRTGLGKRLFEHMLQSENIEPVKMAIDRPSEKFLGFLNKHYTLNDPVKQMNNYVVFDGFFPSTPEKNGNVEIDHSGGTPGKKQSANGLQTTSYTSPWGRYGAPKPPCSMGQIIHNQTSTIPKNTEPTGVDSVRSAPATNYGNATMISPGNPTNVTQSTPNIPCQPPQQQQQPVATPQPYQYQNQINNTNVNQQPQQQQYPNNYQNSGNAVQNQVVNDQYVTNHQSMQQAPVYYQNQQPSGQFQNHSEIPYGINQYGENIQQYQNQENVIQQPQINASHQYTEYSQQPEQTQQSNLVAQQTIAQEQLKTELQPQQLTQSNAQYVQNSSYQEQQNVEHSQPAVNYSRMNMQQTVPQNISYQSSQPTGNSNYMQNQRPNPYQQNVEVSRPMSAHENVNYSQNHPQTQQIPQQNLYQPSQIQSGVVYSDTVTNLQNPSDVQQNINQSQSGYGLPSSQYSYSAPQTSVQHSRSLTNYNQAQNVVSSQKMASQGSRQNVNVTNEGLMPQYNQNVTNQVPQQNLIAANQVSQQHDQILSQPVTSQENIYAPQVERPVSNPNMNQQNVERVQNVESHVNQNESLRHIEGNQTNKQPSSKEKEDNNGAKGDMRSTEDEELKYGYPPQFPNSLRRERRSQMYTIPSR